MVELFGTVGAMDGTDGAYMGVYTAIPKSSTRCFAATGPASSGPG